MMRGYSCIGLWRPKDRHNIGSVLRAAGCFGSKLIYVEGRRYRKAPTDTMGAVKRVPLINVEDLRRVVPYDCVPVAVEISGGAQSLPEYRHPERGFYVFGPEDGSLSRGLLGFCRDVVSIPAGCLNLAAAVNVVLYDRAAKGLA